MDAPKEQPEKPEQPEQKTADPAKKALLKKCILTIVIWTAIEAVSLVLFGYFFIFLSGLIFGTSGGDGDTAGWAFIIYGIPASLIAAVLTARGVTYRLLWPRRYDSYKNKIVRDIPPGIIPATIYVSSVIIAAAFSIFMYIQTHPY